MENEMAMLTEKRLREMEAEMNRFEQEILDPNGPGGRLPNTHGGSNRMIIGANTFQKVKQKITGEDDYEPPRKMPRPPRPPDSGDSDIPLSVLSAPPPPPPSLISKAPAMPAPPPPPPSVRPNLSFVPPQIRARPPPPPPPRGGPPMQGPPRPPHPFMGHQGGPPGQGQFPPPRPGPFPGPPNMMPPRGPPMGGPPGYMGPRPGPVGGPMGPGPVYGVSTGEAHAVANVGESSSGETAQVIEKPKIVYSSAPQITKPEVKKKKKKKGKESNATDGEGEGGAVQGDNSVTPQGISQPPVSEVQDIVQQVQEAEPEVEVKKQKKEKKKKLIRTAAGETWEDPSLEEWESDDFRIFCGDLGNEVTDEVLARAFSRYPTFLKAKVVRDKRTNKTKGYGFVSFKDPNDFVQAMRDMNGKYVGNRPIKLRKSTWKDRNIDIVRKKEKEKKRLGLR